MLAKDTLQSINVQPDQLRCHTTNWKGHRKIMTSAFTDPRVSTGQQGSHHVISCEDLNKAKMCKLQRGYEVNGHLVDSVPLYHAEQRVGEPVLELRMAGKYLQAHV